MTISDEQFRREILQYRLLKEADLLAAEQDPPDGESLTVDQLASRLVDRGLLTQFQVDQVLAGQASGLQLGEYTILDCIGQGGMGTVFKATHRLMKRDVAIKRLSAELLVDAEAVRRFYREVETVAKLSHPYIVAAYDTREQDGEYYLVMEYVDGQDLASRIKQDGPMSIAQAVHCVSQAADGLRYAHEKGVIHRDIKPSNLLLSSDGQIKVLDLGLARLSDFSMGDEAGTMAASLTNTNQIMGTVDYMSPEQAEDTRTADQRADIYSLGCTLYTLLTGAAPYSQDTLMKKLLAHREADLPSLQSQLGSAADQIEPVLQKMIAKRVEDRFQSMSDVIDALRQFAGEGDESVMLQWHRKRSDAFEPTRMISKQATGLDQLAASPADDSDSKLGAADQRLSGSTKARWIVASVLLVPLVVVLLGYAFWKGPATDPQEVEEEDPGAISIADLIEQVEPSIVRVNVWGRNMTGHGSGFVLDRDGTIVTNHHVIENAERAEVVFRDGKTAPIDGYLVIDKVVDLALLKISPAAHDLRLTPLPLASRQPRKGDSVIAFGSPQGLDFSSTEGIVSALRRADDISEFLNNIIAENPTDRDSLWIQTTAPISRGNSGGPLVNDKGEVVGVNTWVITTGQNLNFAVATAEVRQLQDRSRTKPTSLASLVARQDLKNQQAHVTIESELPERLAAFQDSRLLHTFEHHTAAVRDVAVSRDGMYLATASADKSCCIINLATLEVEKRLDSATSSFDSVCFSYDGSKVFTGQGPGEAEDRNVWMWDLASGELEARLYGREVGVLSISASDSGRDLVTTNRTGLVDLRHLQTPNKVNYLGAHDRNYPCFDAAFSPNNRVVVTAGGDGMLFVWSVDAAGMSKMKASEKALRTVSFAPDGDHVLSGGSDHLLRLWKDWNIEDNWKVVQTYTGHEDAVTCSSFSPHGDLFVSGGLDKKVMVWDVKSESPVHIFSGHEKAVTNVVFFPSGRYVASSSEDHTVRIWNVPREKEAD